MYDSEFITAVVFLALSVALLVWQATWVYGAINAIGSEHEEQEDSTLWCFDDFDTEVQCEEIYSQ